MFPPPATVAPETSYVRVLGRMELGWVVRSCLKTLAWFVQTESANRFFVVKKQRWALLA